LHRRWGDIDTSRALRPYLCGVAFRIAAAHRRRIRREHLSSEIEAEDPAGDLDGALFAKQSSAIVAAALDAVPLARRSVVVMHDLEGWSVIEIGARLSLSKFGVYSRLRKGRKELRAALRRLLPDW
jgi:RNA polymerase sigma-70 factor (ECF subfamily)